MKTQFPPVENFPLVPLVTADAGTFRQAQSQAVDSSGNWRVRCDRAPDGGRVMIYWAPQATVCSVK